jgi:hypothetical protein
MDLNESFLDLEKRKLLLRIFVSHMCMMSGKEDLYPTASMKQELAKAIVAAFQCPSIPVNDPNKKNYTHFYNSKITNGFIDTRLKSMKSAKSSEQKIESNEGKKVSNTPVAKKAIGRRPELKPVDIDIVSAQFRADEEKFKVKVKYFASLIL